MPDPDKQAYYKDNRKERLKYQRAYYKKNRKKIKRARDILRKEDPEWVEKRREYNRNYYLKNKDRIRAKREERSNNRAVLSRDRPVIDD